MASTPISNQFKKAGETLRKSVSSQVTNYSQRFEPLSDLHDQLLKDLINTDFSPTKAESTAKTLLGSSKITFAAIDGTEYTNRMFDIIAFFRGSYATRGVIDLGRDLPSVEYSSNLLKEGIGVSSCVPLYINQIVEVEQTYLELGEGGELTVEKPLADKASATNIQLLKITLEIGDPASCSTSLEFSRLFPLIQS